jgi:hypothetical protein
MQLFEEETSMKISLRNYKKSCKDYQKNWVALNEALYGLCRKYPDHKDIAGINAKLWIIGRTYATGMERMIKSTGVQGSSLQQLSKHIYKNRATVDAIFTRVASIAEPLTPEKLKTIVVVHGRFTELLAKKARNNSSPRSFASKYMHCHNRAVPIYDSYASREISDICQWNDEYVVFKQPKEADEEYYHFILLFWQLYRKFKESVRSVSVRLIDQYLLWMAED